MGKELNKYEKAIMSNITLMKVIFFGVVLFNFFMPIFDPAKFGIGSLFQWIIVGVHFVGLLYGTGRILGQRVLLLQVFFIRVLEAIWYRYIPWASEVNWFPFLVCIAVDALFLTFLVLDKNTYTYVVVKKKGNVVYMRRKSDGSRESGNKQIS